MAAPYIISQFGRVSASLEGKDDPHRPVRMINFLAYASKLKFRYGYTPIQPSPVPAGLVFASLGLGYVRNMSGVTEFLGVETRLTSTALYSYDPMTLARTSIASGLNGGDWVVTSYANNAYLINADPSATKTVFRHTIGQTDFVALEDHGWIDQSSPNLTITPNKLDSRGNDSTTDTFAVSLLPGTLAGINGGITTTTASGVLTVSANSFNRVGQHRTIVESAFASTVDWSHSDYIAFTCNAGAIYVNWERTNLAPQIKYGGSWTTLAATEFKEYFSPDNTEVTIVTRIKGLGTNRSAIQGFRITIGGATANTISGTQTAFTVQPVSLGGAYLAATNSSHRLWDGNLDGHEVQYGVRFRGTSSTSSLMQGSIDRFESYGNYPSPFASPLGGKIVLSTPADTSPGTPYTTVEFLRLMADGVTWKVIGTVANSGSPQVQDFYEEDELASLTTASVSGAPPTPPPPFRTEGIVGAFPFKQFMVWLVKGGQANIEMSRVGFAEELYDSSRVYDANDMTQPGQRTLADNAADEPVWGTQAGDTCVIVGHKAAYVMTGDFPVKMSPTRQIAGSRGIIGRFAGARFRVLGGSYAAAYCDPDFNIWKVEAIPMFAGDGRGTPTELSLPVRGLMKSFLFDEQVVLDPLLSGSQVHLEFDEETSSLWVFLGKRAAVLRQDMNEQGWEFFDYSLRSNQGPTTVTTQTPYTGNGATAASVGPGDAVWTNLGNAFADDAQFATAGLIPLGSTKTETLHVTGFTPSPLIPANATINSISFQVDRAMTGDLPLTETKVQPTKGGTAQGSDLNTSAGIGTTEAVQTFTMSSSLLSVADLNSGLLGLDLQYTPIPSSPDWNNPAKWTISVSGATSAGMAVSATYSGSSPAPPFVFLNITSETIVDLHGSVVTVDGPGEWAVNGIADNGQGTVVSGIIYRGYGGDSTHTILDATSMVRTLVPLTGGAGSVTITRVGSGTPLTPYTYVDVSYTGSAAFSPYVLDTALVDSANFSVSYTVDSTNLPSWVGWSQVCFTPDGRRVAIRTTGEIDLVEKDFRNDSHIAGVNRDGGYSPPVAEWWSQNFGQDGGTASLFACQMNTILPTDTPLVYSKVSNGAWVGSFLSGYPSSRWFRFPLSQTGIVHQIKFTLPETSGGVEGATFDFRPASKSKVR